MLRALSLGLTLVACSGETTEPTIDSTPSVDTTPQEVVDSFPQTLNSPVDVLFVVDGEWEEAQAALDEQLLTDVFELYLIADPAWKIGILDPRERGDQFGGIKSQFETWPLSKNPFLLPPRPDSTLRVRESIYSALELRFLNGPNEDFIRSDAHLYVVVMTNMKDETSDDQITLNDFEAWFEDYSPSESKRLAVITDGENADYWEKRTINGGILAEVGSFKKQMERIFLDSMNQRTTFTLTRTPVDPPQYARVVYREHVEEYELEIDFTYDPVTNSITFTKVVPPPDSVIEVPYLPAEEDVDEEESEETTTEGGGTTP